MRSRATVRIALRLVTASAAALVLASCGGDDGVGPGRAADVTVEIERSRFEPDQVTVRAGTTVTFVNLDPFAHTVTAARDAGAEFDSGDLGQDGTFELTLGEPGSYDYFCRIHPTMRARVLVERP